MGEQLIAHICKICGGAFKTRKYAKQHVDRKHPEKVSHRHGPGQHVKYLWVDLENWGKPQMKRQAKRASPEAVKAHIARQKALGENNIPGADRVRWPELVGTAIAVGLLVLSTFHGWPGVLWQWVKS